MYLLTRPFVWLFKLLKKIVLLPAQIFKSVRNRRMRKNVKQMVKANKTAKKESKQQGASTSAPPVAQASPGATPPERQP